MSHLSQFVPSLSVLKDVRILVVDNDSDSRYLCSILFEIYGAKVTTIESIADALTLLDWFIPDILICEIKFSDETVVSLIQRVRAIGLGCDRIITHSHSLCLLPN
jgi:two-component SAPR family response regulator